jgi:hypothetical protein
MYLIPLFLWNLGFWVRFVKFRQTNPNPARKGYLLLGIPISQSPVDVSGAFIQIAAYLVLIEAFLLSLFVQDRVWRAAIVCLLAWISFWVALWIAKVIIRKYDE